MSGLDEDAIRERDIVVATPEKLDFALRNDPSLLDNVALLVFDEGHMMNRLLSVVRSRTDKIIELSRAARR